jgi:hypothetical protein
MRDTLASKLGSWGRKALILGALLGAPALAPAPVEAAPVRGVIGLAVEAPAPAVQPVQWGPRPYYDRRRYDGPRRWHRPPPPPHWRRHQAWNRGYGPPPRYYRHPPRPYYYR